MLIAYPLNDCIAMKLISQVPYALDDEVADVIADSLQRVASVRSLKYHSPVLPDVKLNASWHSQE
jgi:hypothetical protein